MNINKQAASTPSPSEGPLFELADADLKAVHGGIVIGSIVERGIVIGSKEVQSGFVLPLDPWLSSRSRGL